MSTPSYTSSPTKRPSQDSTQVQASKLVKMFVRFKSQIENTDCKIQELAKEEEFLRHEFALQLSRTEAQRSKFSWNKTMTRHTQARRLCRYCS